MNEFIYKKSIIIILAVNKSIHTTNVKKIDFKQMVDLSIYSAILYYLDKRDNQRKHTQTVLIDIFLYIFLI